MKITAVTKFKQGDLWVLLKKHGWSQAELARRAGVAGSDIGRVINLDAKPSVALADKIQRAFAEVGEFLDVFTLWPDRFEGCNVTIEQTQDVPAAALEELRYALAKVLTTLTTQEQAVVDARFFAGKKLAEIGQEMRLSGERIRRLEQRALRKLRHPNNLKTLEQFGALS